MNRVWPPQFIERMQRLYGREIDTILADDGAPARGLRVNTLKCSVDHFRRLWRGEAVPVPFCDTGFAVDPAFKAGADPLHHAGAYYMQEPSAMSAVTVLDPQPGERILDLCAAPGGKSTQIAAGLAGKGLLWSNEYVRARARILAQNIERCGVRNAVVSSCSADVLAQRLPEYFDGVLVDAPCSGEGMFRKEPAALEQWSEDNIRLCAARGREILDAAAAMVRPGGRLVYSTCTFAPEENECQVAAFLQRHPDFMLADTGVSFGRPGLDGETVAPFAEEPLSSSVDLTRCRRITPADGGEGHFLALMVRQGAAQAGMVQPPTARFADEYGKQAEALYRDCFADEPQGQFRMYGGQMRLLPVDITLFAGLPMVATGIAVADICKNRLEPCHAAFMAAQAADCRQVIDLPLDDPHLRAFLKGEVIAVGEERGWTAVAAAGVTVGFGKASNGVLKNRYPKGLRLL